MTFARWTKARAICLGTTDFPFKPEGQPASIQIIPPPQRNPHSDTGNERIVRSERTTKRGIALAVALIGDIHPPVHAVTLFSREYPKGDEVELRRAFAWRSGPCGVVAAPALG